MAAVLAAPASHRQASVVSRARRKHPHFMNLASLKGLRHTLRAQTQYRTRRLPARRITSAFSRHTAHTTIGRIYVINLDRAQERWAMVNRELARFHDQHGNPLSTLTRRFAAIDARHLQGPPPPALLDPTYTLAEQLLVDPHPHLDIDAAAHATSIAMTAQEIAVALSHIEVWKLIAEGDAPHVLVLEDDAYITRACMPMLERAWKELRADHTRGREVDLLYLSYQETRPAQRRRSRAAPALVPPPVACGSCRATSCPARQPASSSIACRRTVPSTCGSTCSSPTSPCG
ncbi:hypothetical protein DDE05_34695 [Streptomyces cavourensis]|nr:hypothetical protein DDE05_34695 [Streptomyces cavourensis]